MLPLQANTTICFSTKGTDYGPSTASSLVLSTKTIPWRFFSPFVIFLTKGNHRGFPYARPLITSINSNNGFPYSFNTSSATYLSLHHEFLTTLPIPYQVVDTPQLLVSSQIKHVLSNCHNQAPTTTISLDISPLVHKYPSLQPLEACLQETGVLQRACRLYGKEEEEGLYTSPC